MKRFVLLAVATLLWAPIASAESLSTLIDEQARDSFAAEMPIDAQFSISFATPYPEDAIMISAYWMDNVTGQFLANAVTADGKVTRVGGLAILTVMVPVPNRRIVPAEILTLADLELIEMPYARVSGYALTSPDALVGMQVRRVLSAGRPVMSQSVMQPLVVDQGDRVTIHYNDGQLSLTAPGRALDGAHRGQELRIVNLASNTVLMGIAAAEGIVEVSR